MNRPNPLYPNIGNNGYVVDQQTQMHQQQQSPQQQQHTDYINQQSQQQQQPTSPTPLHHQSIYRQQSMPVQQPIQTQQFYNTPGLSNSLYRDVQPVQTIQPLQQQSQYVQPQSPIQQVQQSPNSSNTNKSDSLLTITQFNKEEDLKNIFTNSISSIDGAVHKVKDLPDPTLKMLNKKDPSFNYFEPTGYFWSTLVIEKHIELPKEITNALLVASTKSSYGIFPEINRAWISVDQTLYLWDYKLNETTSHNLSQIVVSCTLVNPKKNTFKDNVKKVMVVCTHVEIFLFALCYSSDNKFELLSGLSIPTDNACITDVCGTSEGRIFLSSQDGHIYEIVYSKDSLYWFSNERIKKIKLTQGFVENFISLNKKQQLIQLMYDEERKLLYSLSIDSIINVYNLEATADKFKHYKTIKPIQEYEQSQSLLGGGINNLRIRNSMVMSIHLSSKETQFNFVAILSNGDRLYYTLTNLSYIRMPPPELARQQPPQQPQNNQIHYSYYNNGVFFTSTNINDNEDRLIGTTLFGNDLIKQHYETSKSQYGNTQVYDTLSEKSNIFQIRGRVSVIKEDIVNTKQTVYYKELSNEHMNVPRRFLCLNSLGLHFITKLRYVDILQNILSTNNLQDIDGFFDTFGRIITSSLCISLYCSSPHSSILLSNQIYSSTSIPKTTATRIADLAMTYFKRNSGKPQYHQPTQQTFADMGAAVNKTEMMYSNSYNGLLAYLGRLLLPLWEQPIISPNGNCQWSIVQLQLFQSHFSNLLSFLEISQLIPKGSEIPIIKINNINNNNSNNNNNINIQQQQQQVQQNMEDEAMKNEKRSLIGLKNIIVKSIETLSLLLILSNYNFKQLFDNSNITDEVKSKINLIKFKDVINNEILGKPYQPISINSPSLNNTLSTTENNNNILIGGSNLTNIINQLIDSLMRSLNNHNINIDQVSNQLETECPLFFKKDNRELYKVKEKLNMVLRDGSIYLTETLIRDAVLILESISPNYQINEIVKLLKDVRAFEYITPLCLHYAIELDPRGITLNPSLAPSEEAKEKVKQKQECFKEITDLLDEIYKGDSNNNNNNNNMIISDRQLQLETIDIIINQALTSNDRLVHEIIYSWLLANGFTSRFYDIQTPFITDYLVSNSIDLCWKVLAKHQDYIKASQVLFEIADKSQNLDDKITAYTNCTMILSERKDEEYYIAAKNQITTANIQKQIINRLEDLLNYNVEECGFDRGEIRQSISELNKTIYDYTTLFTNYARKYCLHEQMLYICHIGNHNDQGFIQLLWKIIIEKTIEQNQDGSVISIMESLVSQISNIGYDFYPNEITFPVSYIINIAEKAIFNFTRNKSESEKKQISPNWLTASLHDHVKIDYWVLVDCYNNIIEKENWKEDDQSMLYIICSYFYLVESLINTIQTSTERRLFSSKQILQTLEIREDNFKSIINRLKQNHHPLLSKETDTKLDELIKKFEKIISISKSFKDFRY